MTEIEFVSWSGADNPDNPWWALAYKVRFSVFVEEQKVPAHLEIDEADFCSSTTHTLVFLDGEAIGTSRLLMDKVDEQLDGAVNYHIGRVAVMPTYRGLGFGRKIVQACLERVKPASITPKTDGQNGTEYRHVPPVKVTLDAQVQAMSFYGSLGFSATNRPKFLDAGIWHQEMELTL